MPYISDHEKPNIRENKENQGMNKKVAILEAWQEFIRKLCYVKYCITSSSSFGSVSTSAQLSLGRMTFIVYIQNKYMIESVLTCTVPVQQKIFALGSNVRILWRSLCRI